ncbi:MAG: signal peptidase II [Betaproteobacteria bacterium]|nr:signal peptidase II [Betaproteobacteria bacterium]
MIPEQIRLLRWLALGCALACADQASKWFVLERWVPGERVSVIDGWFDITLVFNRGAAFSFLADQSGWQRWFFTAVSLLAAIVLPILMRKMVDQPLACAALALIWSGALGNGLDRAMQGQVTDFFLFYREAWQFYFPAFNIADSAITVGVIILLIEECIQWRKAART